MLGSSFMTCFTYECNRREHSPQATGVHEGRNGNCDPETGSGIEPHGIKCQRTPIW